MCLSRVQKKATQSIIPGRAPGHLIACLVQCHWSGLGGDSPKGGPAWGHLGQWLCLFCLGEAHACCQRRQTFQLPSGGPQCSDSKEQGQTRVARRPLFSLHQKYVDSDKKKLKKQSQKQVVEISFHSLKFEVEAFILINTSSKFLSCQ